MIYEQFDKRIKEIWEKANDERQLLKAEHLRDHDKFKELNNELRKRTQTATNVVDSDFQKALEEEYGTKGNLKAAKLYEKAWDRAHSSGYHEVECVYSDLAELIL